MLTAPNKIFENSEGKKVYCWNKGKEVTSGRGLYSSLQYNDLNYDSSLFNWQKEKLSEEKIKVTGRMKGIPLRQEWVLDVKGNGLEVKMNILAEEGAHFSEARIDFLIQKDYGEWFYNASRGERK